MPIQETSLISAVLHMKRRFPCTKSSGVRELSGTMVCFFLSKANVVYHCVCDLVLVDALLMAFSDGQDVITLSIGGTDGWTESISAVLTSRFVDQGKVVTVAAGNDVSC